MADVETSIPARFEKIVRQHPERVAVKVAQQTVTYEVLNKAANRVAWAIYHKRGADPEPVLLIAQQNTNAVAALLGVLKAGKILVIADPASPLDELRQILENAQAAVIVTDGHSLPLAQALATSGRTVINIDAPGNKVAEVNPGWRLYPHTVAQIVFSSGSTGSIKGIVFDHRSVLRRAMVPVNATHICPEDRLMEFHKLTFSAGIIGLFRALLSGAAILPYDVKADGLAGMAQFLNREGITILHPGAAILRNWADQVNAQEIFPSVRLIDLSGAPVFRQDVEAYRKIFSSDTILVHTLACSEAGFLSMYFLDRDTEVATAVVPAGYPVEGEEIFLVDEAGKKADPGEAGEIAVRSPYLAIGYWGDSALTKAKFLDDFEGGAKRTFLTGDIGRMLPDGCLFHLERKDFQRKVRGHLISLVEIESTLLDHGAVKESAVAAWDDEAGESFLAAYIVAHAKSPSVSELRRYLRRRLPDYKIPSAFVFLESLPQINGKVDRRSLPRPEPIRPDFAQPYTAAATDIERQLVQIWQEVLRPRSIGIHDDFFDLGGDSLAAARVISAVIKHFQLEIPLPSLFAAPTIAEMARVIAARQGSKINNDALDRMLTEIEAMPDEEAARLLADSGPSDE